jgi:4-aminobutyrate aminotransferase-like enzyme
LQGELMAEHEENLLLRRQRLLGKAYRHFYEQPLHLVRGEGAWLYDADGRRYLDMYNNVPHVGHCHPRVVEAISRQAGRLNTHTRYLHENILDYAERLTGKFPPELDTAMFCCTGSEANELALRIARHVTGASGVIVTRFAYHGNSQAIFEISTSEYDAASTPEFVAQVPIPDPYRGEFRGPQAGLAFAETIRSAIAELQSRGIRPAAFVIDTIVSSGGVVAPPPGYLSGVADIIREAGGVFIADEVQPGFGRTGVHFWGFEADGFVPDIVTMGKPMGNGHPISSVVTKRALADDFGEVGGYFNTFGGNPVSCAAALAVLDVIEQENLQENARVMGTRLLRGINSLAERYPVIGDVRGTGLFIAVELVKDRGSLEPATETAAFLVNELKNRGVLAGSIGPDANILKIRPPMVIDAAAIDLFLGTFDQALAAA